MRSRVDRAPVSGSIAGFSAWLTALALWAALLPPLVARAADASVASGPATVIDSTHLELAGRRFKLYGIDGPDVDETCTDAQGKDYPCGIDARAALADLVKGGSVSCLPRGPNESAEPLAVLVKNGSVSCLPRGPNESAEPLAACSIADTDLAAAMIAAGWAIADRTRTLYYEKAEEDARLSKHGLWQGPFVPPGDWRLGERVPQSHVGKGPVPEKLF